MSDDARLFPKVDGTVLCLKCRKSDSTKRKGRNHLIAVTPQGGTTLYIHKSELDGLEADTFIMLYYDALADAHRGL